MWYKKKIKEVIKVRVDFILEKLESYLMIFLFFLFVILCVMRNNYLMEKSLEDEMMVLYVCILYIVLFMYIFVLLKISLYFC